MGRVLIVLLGLVFGVSANATEPSGKMLFNDACVECHEASDFKGENPNEIAEQIGKIMSGETKHKKSLTLDYEQVAAVASYMATGK